MTKLLAALALTLCGIAHGQTVTFDAIQPDPDFERFFAGGLEIHGPALTLNNGALTQTWGNVPVTITKQGGGTFDLLAMNLADYGNVGFHRIGFSLAFTYGDGRADTFTGTLDMLPGFQTFVLGKIGISSMVLTAQATNLDVECPEWWSCNKDPGLYGVAFNALDLGRSQVQAAPVPEPGTWALLLMGLLLYAGGRTTTRSIFSFVAPDEAEG